MLDLTAQDRCDRCGARANHVAKKIGVPTELLFCNHHIHENEDALLEQDWIIYSDTSPIEPVPVAAYTDRT